MVCTRAQADMSDAVADVDALVPCKAGTACLPCPLTPLPLGCLPGAEQTERNQRTCKQSTPAACL